MSLFIIDYDLVYQRNDKLNFLNIYYIQTCLKMNHAHVNRLLNLWYFQFCAVYQSNHLSCKRRKKYIHGRNWSTDEMSCFKQKAFSVFFMSVLFLSEISKQLPLDFKHTGPDIYFCISSTYIVINVNILPKMSQSISLTGQHERYLHNANSTHISQNISRCTLMLERITAMHAG